MYFYLFIVIILIFILNCVCIDKLRENLTDLAEAIYIQESYVNRPVNGMIKSLKIVHDFKELAKPIPMY